MIIIKKITWEEILPIWTNELWPQSVRQSKIESTSAMSCFKIDVWDETARIFKGIDHYDLENMKFTPTFWGAFDDDKLIGCNSGHMTLDRLYRSRGLYVKPDSRGWRIGQKLLLKTISQAYHERAIAVWSYPRLESWETYNHCEFHLKGYGYNFHWEKQETGTNSRCLKELDRAELRKLRAPKPDYVA
jgi:GNAT superfamily N-acetyltransferase